MQANNGGIFRLIFWIGVIVIVGHCTISAIDEGNYAVAIFGIALFPLTYILYPWSVGLGWLFIVSMISYWISTFIYKKPPVG